MKEEIIKETLRLFKKDGVNFKIIDLANNLKISKKTIYKYFKSKEDLLFDCVTVLFTELHKEQTRIYNDSSIEPLERLKKLILAMPKDFDILSLSALLSLKTHYPKVFNEVIRYLESDWDEAFSLIDECKAKGLIRNVNNQLVRLMYLACSERIINAEYTNYSYNKIEEQFVDIILGGIKNA